MTIIAHTYTIDADKYDRLFALLSWYNAMPNENVGDSFHGNVSDIFSLLLPSVPEFDDDTYYLDTLYIVDGRVLMDVVSTTVPDISITVEIVSADPFVPDTIQSCVY